MERRGGGEGVKLAHRQLEICQCNGYCYDSYCKDESDVQVSRDIPKTIPFNVPLDLAFVICVYRTRPSSLESRRISAWHAGKDGWTTSRPP